MKLCLFPALMLIFVLLAPAAMAADGVTVHTSELTNKMKPEEIDWMVKELERIYPESLQQVIDFVGTEKAKKAFTDFHVMVREIGLEDDYHGWSVSRWRHNTNPSYKRQAITLFAPHFFSGTANVKYTTTHEMLHVVYEFAQGSKSYAKWPLYLKEGICYYGAGQMDYYIDAMINRHEPLYEADQLIDSNSYKRLRYMTFIYCFEREYGLEARKKVLLKLFKGGNYKKVFESETGDDWKKIKRKCKKQLANYLNEKLATVDEYLPIYEAYRDAYALEDYDKPLTLAYQLLEQNPNTIWKPNVYKIIGWSLQNQKKYDKSTEVFEQLRIGKLTHATNDDQAAYQILKNAFYQCDCEKAEKLRKEYERLYPVFRTGWKDDAEKLFNDNCKNRKGEQEGMRTYFYENGNKMSEGLFSNFKKQGKWTYWHQNGQKKDEGEYRDSDKIGSWAGWHDNGKKSYEGTYIDGRRDGTFTWWHENGNVEVTGQLVRGKHEGDRIYYFKNGKAKSKGTYRNNEKEGPWEFYYNNGKKKSEGKYQDGKKIGPWTSWYKNGKKKSEGAYQIHNHLQKKDGHWTFHHFNGQLKSKGEFKLGKEVGHWTYWYEDGKIKSEGEYLNGEKNGKWKFYYGSGTLKEEIEYEEGDKKKKK